MNWLKFLDTKTKKLWFGAVIFTIAGFGLFKFLKPSAASAINEAESKAPAVIIEEVQARDLKKVFRSFGTVLPWKEVILKPQMQSTVREILHAVGDQVAERDVILKSNSEAQDIKSQLDSLDLELKNIDFSVTMALAQKKFLSSKEVKQKELEHKANVLRSRLLQIENAGVLRSPIAGVISDLDYKVGDYVDNNTAGVIRVVDLNKLKIPLFVPQNIVGSLIRNMEVTVTREGLDEPVMAQVATIAPNVDSKTGSVYVELNIDSPPEKLLPGMYVEIEFSLSAASQAKTVPLASLVKEGNKTFVYKVETSKERTPASTDGSKEIYPVTKTEVTLGIQQGDYVEVQSGIEELDQVVTKGVGSLSDGIDVEVIR